jgi:hypothetical protein
VSRSLPSRQLSSPALETIGQIEDRRSQLDPLAQLVSAGARSSGDAAAGVREILTCRDAATHPLVRDLDSGWCRPGPEPGRLPHRRSRCVHAGIPARRSGREKVASVATSPCDLLRGVVGGPTVTDLRLARTRRGWSQSELITHLRAAARLSGRELPADETLRSMISRWEAGQHKPSPFYRQLFDAVYQAGETTGGSDELALRSHQFIPVWVSPAASDQLVAAHEMARESDDWTLPHCAEAAAPTGASCCHLYVWKHGIAILHVVDELVMPSLAALALWRQETYLERLSWAEQHLRPHAPVARAAYVLSLYWLHSSSRSGHEHETAMRLLCMPRVLLERELRDGDSLSHARARLAEDALLAARWDHPDIRSFGVVGTSWGYASWSGVVYHASAAPRALSEDELVAYELAVQSTWAYCAHLNGEVEEGRDPVVPDEWGWRYLRAMHCRVANPRPQETGQHRSMREAVLETSGLAGHLDQAMQALRDAVSR